MKEQHVCFDVYFSTMLMAFQIIHTSTSQVDLPAYQNKSQLKGEKFFHV